MPVPRTEIMGNAVADAAWGNTKDGRGYIFVRVACSKRKQVAPDRWEDDKSIFINVRYWDADNRNHIPLKGDKVRAHGDLHMAQETGKDGRTYSNLVLDADSFAAWPNTRKQGGVASPGADSDPWAGQNTQQKAPQQSTAGQQTQIGEDDEPPF